MTENPRTSRRSRSAIEAGCGDALVELLDPDPIIRRYAVDGIRLDSVGLYALRERLLDDSHGPVRAAAAERLARAARARFDDGAPSRGEANAWIREALCDRLPSVREISCRAALRHGSRDPALETCLAQRLTRDPVWRVRRAAARALAGVAGASAIPPLITALEDPFWRVRHGVIQALALVVARSSKDEDERARLRAQILEAGAGLEAAARAALAYLASEWPEGEDEVPEVLGLIQDPGAGLELADADPAVVTARLQAARGAVPTAEALIPLLAESHVPLREEAARRLAGIDDPLQLLPALAWLEDPRVPNAPATVRRLLSRLGRRAEALVEPALDSDRPGALAWAAGWIATHPAERLHPRVAALAAHARPEVRGAAMTAMGRLLRRDSDAGMRELLVRGLDDPSARVRDAAALAVYGASPGARSKIGARPEIHPSTLAGLGAATRAQLAARGLPLETWRAAIDDPDARVRAAAWRGAPPEIEPARLCQLAAELRRDPDPWMRSAHAQRAPEDAAALLAGEKERDPSVRRAAARALARARARARAQPILADPQDLDALLSAMLADGDPWVRARGAELVDPLACEDRALARLLLATRDPAAMVRLSAAARLDRVPDEADRLEALLAAAPSAIDEHPDALRVAAWSRLVSAWLRPESPESPDPPSTVDTASALARLETGLAAETHQTVRAHLRELAVVFGGAAPPTPLSASEALDHAAAQPAPAALPQPPSPEIQRRALGRSGLEVAPLIVSGAFSLTPSSLAAAAERGVDTFFWEPRYANSTRFLRQPRRRDLQVVAGSFHADAKGLARDLETARRRLRRDHIDLFLLYWVRSPARLDPAALDALREFQRRGLIRSFGFSTHDRAIGGAAVETGDWPVIMTRHSAAHTGSERALFPAAHAAGVGVLGFSALCYGRMLQPSSVFPNGPAAVDCYRYSLGQPAVAACVSAPRSHRELEQNLAVLDRPRLGELEGEALRAHGREIYAESKRFDRLVRRGGAAPLREALLELFERAGEAEPAAVHSSEARTDLRTDLRTDP